jgi:hypothetical protein
MTDLAWTAFTFLAVLCVMVVMAAGIAVAIGEKHVQHRRIVRRLRNEREKHRETRHDPR